MKLILTFISLLFITNITFAQFKGISPTEIAIQPFMEYRVTYGFQNMNAYDIKNRKINFEFDINIPNGFANIGFGYRLGGGFNSITEIETAGEEYNYYSFNYTNTLKNTTATVNYRFVNWGVYYRINKFLTGNFFDGGLSADLYINLDVQSARSRFSFNDDELYQSEELRPEYGLGAFVDITSNFYILPELRIAYSIPLNKGNLVFNLGLQKTVATISSVKRTYGTKLGYSAINFGISFCSL